MAIFAAQLVARGCWAIAIYDRTIGAIGRQVLSRDRVAAFNRVLPQRNCTVIVARRRVRRPFVELPVSIRQSFLR